MAAMMATMPIQVKKKQPRFIFILNGRRITCSESTTMPTTTTHSHLSKRKTHPDLDLDPVVVVKKQRQMQVVPNSRVQSSYSNSQLPYQSMDSTHINQTTTHHHSTPNFQVSNANTHQRFHTNATEIYESKLKNSQRKLHQGYEALDRAKKQRQIVVIGGKPNSSSHKKSIPKGSRFKTKKLQRLYENHKTRPL